ncbi:MAG: bifunctional DNA-formamidopyrimidine glycosylase/DNA-(apurinic or apyrimidinic site) lyase [Euryarchaeota archaeon]|jgi:formamidopyrimidine-DNA glycosylase|nr:MAG: formamidopyrimidine/5-formyluracil/ 5-hydroxymethyluracil DNA glycosylase [uncultured Candidatus Poseidoniales archaeon]MBT3452912.1 bifunctional DNA-formamidopyrimidine glycosylase/DNA-(apurinic or apyrimidinic site) lyase [Euryarchaeota archaeon]MDC3302820.1 bifunctional DNA-formamidopyrimidine glycosylase/DNA-(apurinic or apyrimidinic site) lyase [Candidatus Poseidoniaceae archaeon]MBT5122383.1 bifunctional DNA-formamidopyrimidine glycosylase/DNA-(apurinic or apyrimidinic site) lyase 
MPELPEVETVRTGLEQAWVGRRIEHVKLRRKDLRFPFPANMAERLTGQTVLGVRRRAKYLLIDLEDGAVFLSHLGMSGRYTLVTPDEVARINPGPTPQTTSPFGALTGFDGRHDHMEFRFDDGSVSVYTDPRRFGIADVFERAEEPVQSLLEHLGPEPFDGWNASIAAKRIGKKRSAIKITLLDQRFVVGVGNIYACEALHRSGIAPTTPSNTLVKKNGGPTKRLERLVNEVKSVLNAAIAVGGSTLNDFAAVDGTLGYFGHHFQVYDREDGPCLKDGCSGTIERIVQSNRSTFLCPRCQK